MNNGIADEFRMCKLGDKRLDNRLIQTAETLFNKIGASIPMASGNWADTKAVYRFLDQQRFTEDKIIEGHLQETANRFKCQNSKVLILHDTTELTYHRSTNCIGNLKRVFVKKRLRSQNVTIQGLLFHTSLAVTLQGLPNRMEIIDKHSSNYL